MSTVTYKVFFFLLHSVFSIIEQIYELLLKLWSSLLQHYEEAKAENALPKLKQMPKHMTVLLGLEEPSHKDLANLILWCMSAHITFISFYDSKGMLQKQEDKLRQVVTEKQSPDDHVIWHGHPDTYKNGFTGRKVHVKVLSRDDGRGDVVEVTKKLSEGEKFNMEKLEEALHEEFEFPNPDLGVCCGKTFSLFGYPPWQIPVTEFLLIDSHHNVTYDCFVNLLRRYNTCEQRFGK